MTSPSAHNFTSIILTITKIAYQDILLLPIMWIWRCEL